MTASPGRLDKILDQVAQGGVATEALSTLIDGGFATLAAASSYLSASDLPLPAVERIEDIVKQVILARIREGMSPAKARDLALAQERLGFFVKRKSYAIKASSPLGYSLFFQQPGEGFSFQRHIEHKVEIFHILSGSPGSYVFACSYDAWKDAFNKDRFANWLTGTADSVFERYRYTPESGDVIVIDRLNVVHTVIGCVLEEFATISTDMVDRLFDQNAGKPVPAELGRQRMMSLLRELPEVEPRRVLRIGTNGFLPADIVPRLHSWGETRELSAENLTARHIVVHPGAVTAPMYDHLAASSLFVRAGRGILTMGNDGDLSSQAVVEVNPGALLLVPNGIYWRVSALETTLRLSEQKLSLDTAFVSRH
jgi:mannose-6-phosphate isomerase-like protein (cupin superfamily)